jgi:hypothetical protein
LRKAAAILFLFGIIFNVIGHFSMLFFLQKQIKKEIKIIINSNLNQDDIEIIEIPLEKTQDRSQKSEVRSQKVEDTRQKTQDRSQKSEVRSQKIEDNIQNSEFRIQNSEFSRYFHRIDKGEFRYKGKMYDIVKEVKTNESVIFYCINDKKEEQLLSQFSEQIKNSIGSDSPIGKMMKKLINYSLNDLFCFINNLLYIPNYINIINFCQSITLNSLKIDIPSPPPKYIS